MTMYAGLIAALLNPFDPLKDTALAASVTLAIMAAVAIAVGCVESLVARLRMRFVPHYLMLATAMATLALLASGWMRAA